jgi:hypothetical protein
MKYVTMMAVCIFLAPTSLPAQDRPSVPDTAIKEMQFLIGKWNCRGTFNGKQMNGVYEAEWAPGKHCLFLKSTFAEKAAGIGGWDAAKKQYVEYWYDADGTQRTFFYTIRNDELWDGTWSETDARGAKGGGQIRLEKGKDRYVVVATGKSADGKDLHVEIINEKQ